MGQTPEAVANVLTANGEPGDTLRLEVHPLLVRADGRVEMPPQLAQWLGLSAMPQTLADLTGSLALALLLPALCYAVIACFGYYARRPAV